MNNSPYPRHTIGNPRHSIYDIHTVKGLIRGICKIYEPVQIKVSSLKEFNYLSPGEVLLFDEQTSIEVVDFNVNYGGASKAVPELNAQSIELKPGATLVGPVAWKSRTGCFRPSFEPPMSHTSAVLTLALIVGCYVALWFIEKMAFWTFGVGTVFFGSVVYAYIYFRFKRLRSIERQGSVNVLAPAERLWPSASSDSD